MTATPAVAAATEIQKYTLLVVDDEEGPRQSLRMVFRNEYNVHAVENLEQALGYARSHTVHLAILDIRMAGGSGIEVLQGLKQIDDRIEVIMLTAYETLDTARQALRLGACDYLSKPFDLSTVRASASRALHLRKISDIVASTSERLAQLNERLENTAVREDLARTTNEIYAGVIHDINNPLGALSLFVQMLQERLKTVTTVHGNDLDNLRKGIDFISKQVSTCTAIAARYLRFIHKHETPARQISINQVLADLQSLMETHPEARFQKLNFKPLDLDAIPLIDGTDLIQILLNLTINALQSTESKQSIWIVADVLDHAPVYTIDHTTNTERLLGTATFNHTGPVISLSVIDQGKGIAPTALTRIFEAYFTTKSDTGTGIGLSIVSRLVQVHGALLHVKTCVGEGTTMTLLLPRQD